MTDFSERKLFKVLDNFRMIKIEKLNVMTRSINILILLVQIIALLVVDVINQKVGISQKKQTKVPKMSIIQVLCTGPSNSDTHCFDTIIN